MKTLQNRNDISILVHAFYDKIRKNELLGPIFHKHIAENEWAAHLEKLTDFWETNLFGIAKFKGNPTAKHIKVDQLHSDKIEPNHFGAWLQLWFETIDQHFEGELADKAKASARKMGTGQYIAIWNNRPENRNPTYNKMPK